MQEGILALMQLPRTTIAVQRLREARRPYIVVLTNPTTGGVTASYAMLGEVERAETILRGCEARLGAAGEHAGLAFLNDQRARLARRLGDRERLRAAVADMRGASIAAKGATSAGYRQAPPSMWARCR